MTDDVSNLVNSPLMFALVRRRNDTLAAKKKAADAYKRHNGAIKSHGIKIKNFDAVYALMMAADGGDEYMQDLREQQRIAQLLKLPVGHQFSIIDEFDAMEKAKEEGEDKSNHFQRGTRAFLAGEDENECPHATNTTEGQDWLRGYRWAESQYKEGEAVMRATAVDDDEAQEDGDDGDDEPPPAKTKRKTAKRATKKAAKANGVGAGASASPS